MYIARLLIDRRTWYRCNMDNSNARKGLLWHLFDRHHLPYNSGGWVFRVASKEECPPDYFVILVVSRFSPDANAFQQDGIKIEIKVVPDDIFVKGALYRFKSRVNPVTCDFFSKKRIPKDPNDVPRWVAQCMEKAAKCICKVDNVGVQISYKNNQKITHHSVDVSGMLEVLDNKQFVELLVNGIGRAKRYGFGLIDLSV